MMDSTNSMTIVMNADHNSEAHTFQAAIPCPLRCRRGFVGSFIALGGVMLTVAIAMASRSGRASIVPAASSKSCDEGFTHGLELVSVEFTESDTGLSREEEIDRWSEVDTFWEKTPYGGDLSSYLGGAIWLVGGEAEGGAR